MSPALDQRPLLNGFSAIAVTKIAQVLKTVDTGFVAVAPAKIQSVPADNTDIIDLDFIGNCFRLKRSFARPFIHALSAGAGAA
jgi:hypothetical protein